VVTSIDTLYDDISSAKWILPPHSANPKESSVLVADFEAFYPTIDVTKVVERFKVRLKKSGLSAREQEAAIRCAEDLTSVPGVNGLPIGPPLSHFLANIFLREIDEKLSERYRGRYFRYVDDIAIVVSRSEFLAARKYLADLADSEGLRIHPEKEEEVPSKTWIDSVEARHVDGPDRFTSLVNDLRTYLAFRPDEFDDVKESFHRSHAYLPFRKLRSTASYNRFRMVLRRMMPKLRGFSSPSDMLDRAKTLRAHFWSRLEQLSLERLPMKGMARRWTIQEYRFTINRLLYLAQEKDRAKLLHLTPDCEELATTRAILSALVSGDASEILKFTGPPISAFCQLWLESRDGRPKVNWSTDPLMQEWDSAAILALYGLSVPPNEWITKLPEGPNQIMVRLAVGGKPNRRTFDDFSYDDEMESLWLPPQFDALSYLSTRFDDGERVVLPALEMGGDSYMT
jgi:Reverse transcriptase (RNA-dependent DNA polymerase)